ncbi:MAG: biosynthetic peptidoglycan transglycosylase [Myxococcota bacterium]
MKRRLVAAGLVAVVIAYAGLVATVRLHLIPQAARRLGRPIAVGGVSVGLPLALRLLDVRVDGLFDAPEIRVEPSGILLVRPTLHLDHAGTRGVASAPVLPADRAALEPPAFHRVRARDAVLISPFGRVEAARAAVDVDGRGRPLRIAAWGVHVSAAQTRVRDLTLFARRAQGGWHVRFAAEGATLDSARLASRPVGPMAVDVDAKFVLGPSLRVREAVLRTGALRIALDGEASPTRLRLRAHLERARCAEALASLPRGLAPTLEGMQLDGNFEAEIAVDFDAATPDTTRFDARFPALCRVVADSPAAPVPSLLEASAPVVGPGGPVVIPPIERLGRIVPAAFVAAEDTRFYTHHGFDPARIAHALGHDLSTRRFARGASTISQQLVKNLYLHHDRNIGRKIEEAVLTWRLEQIVPKRRILEIYLGVIEMGPGLWGVTEAARAYFGREPARLRPIEAAHLAALAPSPVRSARMLASTPRGQAPWDWHRRVFTIVDGMRRLGTLTRAEWLAARAMPLRILPPGAARIASR